MASFAGCFGILTGLELLAEMGVMHERWASPTVPKCQSHRCDTGHVSTPLGPSPLSASWSARGAEQARIGGLLHCVATLRVHGPAMTPPLGRLSEGPDGRG